MSEPILCYVEGPWAYFTTQSLEKQWGDDWDDKPFTCNSGEPYEWFEGRDGDPWEIIKVAYDGDLDFPAGGFWTDPNFSVQQVNSGAIAWLTTPSWVKEQVVIPAGCPLTEFCQLVRKAGGTVYLPQEAAGEAK